MGKYGTLSVNGNFNYSTAVTFQRFLKDHGWYHGLLDGQFPEMSWKSAQWWLELHGFYFGLIDGNAGPRTWQAMRGALRKHKLWYQIFPTSMGWNKTLTSALQRFLNSRTSSNGHKP